MVSVIFLLFLFVVGALGRQAEDVSMNCIPDQCFHRPAEECPPESYCKCRKLPSCNQAMICCNIPGTFELTESLGCAGIGNSNVIALHIRNGTFDSFNVSNTSLRRLKYISITDGKINSIVGSFQKMSYISCVNLSSNAISSFEERSLVNLYNLTLLDLSNNNLTEIPSVRKGGSVVTIDVSGNQHMLCSSLSSTLNHSDVAFLRENETFCSSAQSFHWFNSTELLPLNQIKMIHKVERDCFKNCSCRPTRFDIVAGQFPTLAVAVNCFNQGFMSLPSPLPPNTISLNISNNNVTSLKEINDPSYKHLRQLYADNNQISSIQPLEGSKFLSEFMAISLKNNKIKSLETYLLSNIKFDRNSNDRHAYLGGNKLHCDCNTAKDLKVWLLTKQTHIPDYSELVCDNMNSRIIDLNKTKLCQTQQDWTDYIYYIITAEVLLLVGLIAKVSYDYWVFKTAGYLPWPASKMPKLPCDWLCE